MHTEPPTFSMYIKCKNSIYIFGLGTPPFDKLNKLLTEKMLLNDIKKLSSDAQTSCLEGFHATLNHWHPKMFSFSWLGSYCRYSIIIIFIVPFSNVISPFCMVFSSETPVYNILKRKLHGCLKMCILFSHGKNKMLITCVELVRKILFYHSIKSIYIFVPLCNILQYITITRINHFTPE